MATTTDIAGQAFGPWLVLRLTECPPWGKGKGAYWLCRCSCGREEAVAGARLRAGRQRRGCSVCSGTLHRKRGKCSPTYNSWRAMRGRCLRPDDDAYDRYGGKGITICDRWRDSFDNFLADMGERPAGKSLDRIDPTGNYEPSNCRWADAKTQSRNSSHFRLSDEQVIALKEATAYGVPARVLATLCGVTRGTVAGVLNELGSYANRPDSPDLAMREAMKEDMRS